MVKLTGPGLSTDASGSLADQLTFSSWKGKSYLKKHRKPKQPRAKGQVAMRAMMGFLSAAWAALSSADKATWTDLANRTNIPPFNAYQAENLKRWRSGRQPSQAYPAAEIITCNNSLNYSVTPIPQAVLHLWEPRAFAGEWGWLIFHDTLVYPGTHWYKLVYATANIVPHIFKWKHAPLANGPQRYYLWSFSTDGRLAEFGRAAECLVT